MLTHDILEAAYKVSAITPKVVVDIRKVPAKKIDKAFDMALKIISEKGLTNHGRSIDRYEKLIEIFFKQKNPLKRSAEIMGITYESARSMRYDIINAFKDRQIYEYLFGKEV